MRPRPMIELFNMIEVKQSRFDHILPTHAIFPETGEQHELVILGKNEEIQSLPAPVGKVTIPLANRARSFTCNATRLFETIAKSKPICKTKQEIFSKLDGEITNVLIDPVMSNRKFQEFFETKMPMRYGSFNVTSADYSMKISVVDGLFYRTGQLFIAMNHPSDFNFLVYQENRHKDIYGLACYNPNMIVGAVI